MTQPRPSRPRVAPLTEPEWNEEQAAMLGAAGPSGGRLGDLNIFTTLARNPTLFDAWQRFGLRLLVRGTLPAADRELVILRTAYLCRSPYEWGHHVEIGAAAGLDAEVVARVAAGPGAAGWSDREAALLRAVDECHADSRIGDDTWARLATLFDEPMLIELVMLIGQYHLVAFALNSLGVQPEPGLDPLPD
jgi:4-carboxymuconolactone decarboxylase